MRPVDEVTRLHEHDARIFFPSVFSSVHVCSHYIVAAILATQDMRVTNASAFRDTVAAHYWPITIESIPVTGILANREAQLFLKVVISTTLKIGKEITRIGGHVPTLFLNCTGTDGQCCKEYNNCNSFHDLGCLNELCLLRYDFYFY